MGGSHQSTCPPPPAPVSQSHRVRGVLAAAVSSSSQPIQPSQFGTIRFHESNNEAHFHDDAASIKCAIPKADFDTAYMAWRASVCQDPLTLLGTDGKKTKTTVQFHMYPQNGKMEVGIIVSEATSGQSLVDLDTLAGI